MATINELAGIFRTVFEDDSITINPLTTADQVDGWDSLSHAVLILAVENHYNIKFSQKELLTLRNVGDLVKAVDNKIA
jgi:acyl carrier protein